MFAEAIRHLLLDPYENEEPVVWFLVIYVCLTNQLPWFTDY
jgi:hypothetical protein